MSKDPMKPAMRKFYFTYGNSSDYPFRNGWTLIFAPDMKAAQEVFKAYHPNPSGDEHCLNCADFYDEEHFHSAGCFRTGNFGAYCHEIIGPWPTDPTVPGIPKCAEETYGL